MKLKELGTLSPKQSAKLNYLPFNRNASARKELVTNMQIYGFVGSIILIYTNLITGKWEHFIADGQHRVKSAIFANLPLNYSICQVKFDKVDKMVGFVSSLNSTSLAWTIDDYVNAYCYLNYAHYVKLVQHKESSIYSISTCSKLLYGIRSRTGQSRGGSVSDKIKSGHFKINDEKGFIDLMTLVNKLLPLHQNITGCKKPSSRMIHAIHYIKKMDQWNEKKFIRKYKDNIKEVSEKTLDDYSDIFHSWIK